MRFCLGFVLCSATLVAQAVPPGWKTIKDSRGKCQISVPADFSLVHAAAGFANAKDRSIEVIVTSREGGTLKPISAEGMKTAGVDKILENTAQRRFYAMKSISRPAASWYEIVPYAGGTCTAHISVREGASQDLFRAIAATLSAVK